MSKLRRSVGGRISGVNLEGNGQAPAGRSRGWERRIGLGFWRRALVVLPCSLLLMNVLSCGNSLGVLEPADLCNCLPLAPDALDYRHAAKHVPIANIAPIETDVATMLTWKQDLAMPPDAPRTGRELQVFHVAHSFLQNASVNSEDCDVHLEISGTAEKTAKRVIVETPVDSEYCSARKSIQTLLSQNGFKLDTQHGGELPQSIPVQVTGMAFEDFEHDRGPDQVATLWELHPAIVTAQ